MTTSKQPLLTHRFKTTGGISLRIKTYPRAVKSSSRCDAKTIGYDYETLFTRVSLPLSSGRDIELIRTFTLDDIDAEGHIRQDMIALMSGLGAMGDWEPLMTLVKEARAELLAQRDENRRRNSEIVDQVVARIAATL